MAEHEPAKPVTSHPAPPWEEVVEKEYVVVGPYPVNGVKTGQRVKLSLTETAAAGLIEAGAIASVQVRPSVAELKEANDG